jgi:hypothetical protein
MLGGLITSAFLTLEVLPVLYTIWRAHQLARAQRLILSRRAGEQAAVSGELTADLPAPEAVSLRT